MRQSLRKLLGRVPAWHGGQLLIATLAALSAAAMFGFGLAAVASVTLNNVAGARETECLADMYTRYKNGIDPFLDQTQTLARARDALNRAGYYSLSADYASKYDSVVNQFLREDARAIERIFCREDVAPIRNAVEPAVNIIFSAFCLVGAILALTMTWFWLDARNPRDKSSPPNS